MRSGLPFSRTATPSSGRDFSRQGRQGHHLCRQDIIYNEITAHDNALTRPWSITEKAQRNPKARPLCRTAVCGKQYEGQDRRRALFPERGWQAHADPQGPIAAGLAIFTRKQQ
jgi:hypothetical protein